VVEEFNAEQAELLQAVPLLSGLRDVHESDEVPAAHHRSILEPGAVRIVPGPLDEEDVGPTSTALALGTPDLRRSHASGLASLARPASSASRISFSWGSGSQSRTAALVASTVENHRLGWKIRCSRAMTGTIPGSGLIGS